MSNINGRTVTTPLNPNKFASSGFGYGEPMRWLGFDTKTWTPTGMFQEDLEAAFASLPQFGSMQVQFYDKNLNGQKHTGTLWKYTDGYGFLTADNYSGVKAIKTYYNYKWNAWETEDQTLEANKEYRTTERINGKAVYKISDDAGNVMYRLEGDTEWSSYADFVGGREIQNLEGQMATDGAIGSGNKEDIPAGESYNGSSVDSYVRSGSIAVSKGDIVKYANMEAAINFAVISVYDSNKVLLRCITQTSAKDWQTITITEDGYIRLCNKKSNLSAVKVELHKKKEGIFMPRKTLNILVLGNSYSQDSFAYLPPVLNEILHDYSITYGVAYADSCEPPELIDWLINKNPPKAYPEREFYTYFNYWAPGDTKWSRSAKYVTTIEEVVAKKKWDIIFLPTAGSSSSDKVILDNIINPCRTILNWLQDRNGGPFSLMIGSQMAVSDTSFVKLINGMEKAKTALGIADYIPITTAIENARTNTVWKKTIGKAGNLLYDNHMQAGIPALIATYTIALKILECVGESYRGIYDSSFVPTDEVCLAINAANESYTKHMTHGHSMGVTAENIKLAQEYAVLAVNNPTKVSDGKNIAEDTNDYKLTEEEKQEIANMAALSFKLTDAEKNEIANMAADSIVVTPGKSAYEYAKEAGYEGTEAQFAYDLAYDTPEFEVVSYGYANTVTIENAVMNGKPVFCLYEGLYHLPLMNWDEDTMTASFSGCIGDKIITCTCSAAGWSVSTKTIENNTSGGETTEHINNKNNPHGVTKAQVGLGNVPNVATDDQTPTFTVASTLATLTSGEKLSVAFGKIAKAITDLISHIANKSNPHSVTAAQAGAVPTSRTVNNKALSSNISLSASDVGAVPTSRTVNGKALSANISLSASDVGAAAASHTQAISTITGLTDYVTANGTSGVWSYWKFNSGLCIAMGIPTVAWGSTTQVTSGQSRSTASLDLSGIFTSVMGGTCSNVHRYVNCFVIPSGGTSAELWATTAVAATSAPSSNFSTTPMVVLFGKWK